MTHTYTDRQLMDMADWLRAYDFDFSEADDAEIQALIADAVGSGWDANAPHLQFTCPGGDQCPGLQVGQDCGCDPR